MNDVPIAAFEEAICATHGADQAMYTGRSAVHETFGDASVNTSIRPYVITRNPAKEKAAFEGWGLLGWLPRRRL